MHGEKFDLRGGILAVRRRGTDVPSSFTQEMEGEARNPPGFSTQTHGSRMALVESRHSRLPPKGVESWKLDCIER
jgi:hypothetical protein